ncbi:MAG: VOC family protein [Candidatus Heimdallarchaeota archaeon]|nr:VOC family protein [Candidatus Heimdallarchaeota archaeon]
MAEKILFSLLEPLFFSDGSGSSGVGGGKGINLLVPRREITLEKTEQASYNRQCHQLLRRLIMTKHQVVHIEFSAKDPMETGKFYADLFGWKIEHSEEMNYVSFDSGEGPGGGFPEVGENTKAGAVTVYISTDDVEASLAKAESLGGKILVTKTEIPMTGWFGIFSDPTGNAVGVFQSLSSE